LKFITKLDYLKYRRKHPKIMMLAEEGEEYKIPTEEERKYGQETLEKIDKKHDKMVKVIFSQKREVATFINQFINLEEKIKAEQLQSCQNEFITWQYKGKQVDIVYRLKEKPVYFLIEHQSTVNQKMVEKIGSYIEQIMEIQEWNNEKLPIVVSIVIYTGFQKWTAKTKLSEKQYAEEAYKEYQNNLWYNLVAVQDYTFEELLKTNTLFTSFLIMEKCETKEELLTYSKKIIDKIKKEENKKLAKDIIKKIFRLFLGEEVITEMLKELEREEEISMSPATKMLLDLELKGREKGIVEGIMQTAKKMIERNMKLKEIQEITGLSKEEIEKLQECQ